MHIHQSSVRVLVAGSLAAASVLGTATLAAAAPTAAAHSAASTAAAVPPVSGVHWGPKDLIGGSGVVGATVTLTDATGKTRSAVVGAGNWFFISPDDLTPVFSLTQTIDGRTSAPVEFATPADVAVPQVHSVTSGQYAGSVTGLGLPNVEIRVEGADGQVTTVTNTTLGRFTAYPLGFERPLSISQKHRGHWSEPVTVD